MRQKLASATTKPQAMGWALLLLWLVATSVLLFRFGQSDYGEFDPKLQLRQHPAKLDDFLELSAAKLGETILLHVLDPACRCAALAEDHIAQLQPSLQNLPKLRQLAPIPLLPPSAPTRRARNIPHREIRRAGVVRCGHLRLVAPSAWPLSALPLPMQLQAGLTWFTRVHHKTIT